MIGDPMMTVWGSSLLVALRETPDAEPATSGGMNMGTLSVFIVIALVIVVVCMSKNDEKEAKKRAEEQQAFYRKLEEEKEKRAKSSDQ